MHDLPKRRGRDTCDASSVELEGRYANYFELAYSAFEFIMDFGQYHPESQSARHHTRLVTGPVYAKLLGRLLQQALDRYEAEHGTIEGGDEDVDPMEAVTQSLPQYERRGG